MKFRDIADNINGIINERLDHKFTTTSIEDNDFRCVSVYIHDNNMTYKEYADLRDDIFNNYEEYVLDYVEIEQCKCFNIYIQSNEYIRKKKLDQVTYNIYTNKN